MDGWFDEWLKIYLDVSISMGGMILETFVLRNTKVG
jgi:hypothetical protein